MNKDNAKDYLPLIKAMSEGKVIQHKNNFGDWKDTENLVFSDSVEFYRIKPETNIKITFAYYPLIDNKFKFDLSTIIENITKDQFNLFYANQTIFQKSLTQTIKTFLYGKTN
jgi:hypothetical protein